MKSSKAVRETFIENLGRAYYYGALADLHWWNKQEQRGNFENDLASYYFHTAVTLRDLFADLKTFDGAKLFGIMKTKAEEDYKTDAPRPFEVFKFADYKDYAV